MNRLLLATFLLLALTLPAHAGEKAGTILIHPGEVVYARFEAKGKKIKLVSSTKVKDEGAQVIFTLLPDEKKGGYSLKVENKFSKDLRYRAEMRSLTRKMKFAVTMTPVVGGKLALESFPKEVEQVAAYEFQLEK
jgi:hypothetical protein